MNYILMHKNKKVIDLSIDEDTGTIINIGTEHNSAHLPVGTVKSGAADKSLLNKWWTDRSIPASRSGVREALDVLRIDSPKMLLDKCFGLSLSDQYWIKPVDSDLDWDLINFFENDFSQDIGDVLFGKAKDSNNIDLNSPDNTSDGCLKKRWKILDGKRCLIKGGSDPFQQQPYNEVIASIIMDKLGVSHVDYSLITDEGNPYSICEDFITKDTELVSAWKILQQYPKPNHLSIYQHYINTCEAFGIEDIVQKVNEMIVVDFIIANEDRHLNNFGLIRNADTLEWLGVAPIFDSGSSLGYNKVTANIEKQSLIDCKPFKKSHFEQLKLVSSFEWINFEALEGIDDEIYAVLSCADENTMDTARKDKIVSSIKNRIDYLQKLIQADNVKQEDDISDDVEEDIADDYTNPITMC